MSYVPKFVSFIDQSRCYKLASVLLYRGFPNLGDDVGRPPGWKDSWGLWSQLHPILLGILRFEICSNARGGGLSLDAVYLAYTNGRRRVNLSGNRTCFVAPPHVRTAKDARFPQQRIFYVMSLVCWYGFSIFSTPQ